MKLNQEKGAPFPGLFYCILVDFYHQWSKVEAQEAPLFMLISDLGLYNIFHPNFSARCGEDFDRKLTMTVFCPLSPRWGERAG